MEMLWTWLLSFFFILALLCILGYQLVCLVDLEYDYINPYDSSSRINNVIVPEFIIQGVMCFILLVARHWFMLFLSLPHLYYNVNLYMTGRHLVDVTEIYNQLSWEKKQRFFKIGYLLVALERCRRVRLTRHCCSHQARPLYLGWSSRDEHVWI